MTYATQKEQEVAAELGYKETRSQQSGSRFVRGKRHVWPIKSGWQTADLVDSADGQRYANHEPFASLTKALKRHQETDYL